MRCNLLLMTDSYKLTHWKQYPPGTEIVYSYFESRGGKFGATVFFGLQYFLMEYLSGPVVTREKIEEAADFVGKHLGDPGLFNREGWEYILTRHGGRLPVVIRAVPEGTVVPTHNVLITIENTDPRCYWLTNYLETLLVEIWYPVTVATLSHEMRKLILGFLERTGDPSLVDFKLHDFGFRGVSSPESAAIGGAAHLVNFLGTDTIHGIIMARDYYDCEMAGFSIPAAEHSTITAWGKEREADSYRHIIDQFPTGLVSVVSDSYDVHHACREIWGRILKDKVLARKGTVVIRPDSGHPPVIVVEVLEILGNAFGFTVNEKGYKVLNPKVRIIQGDGIDYEMTGQVLQHMADNGWATDNIAFGMGGALLQKLNRDTQHFAFKCSSVTVNGVEYDVYKKPVTDLSKVSKAGRLKLIRAEDGSLRTVHPSEPGEDLLVEVFRDGEIRKKWTFEECRARAKG